jgi:sugar lactone lactonase YvrE
MPFEVGLRMRNFDEMQARIARGELISPAEKEAKYFPLASDHDRVVQWLKAEGFEVTRTDPDRLAIFARGTVDAVGKTFQVTFARVVTSDGEFSSAVTAPSLPSDISPAVLGIHGLQPHIRRHSLSAPRAPGGGQTINLNGYTPAQISAAYNATGLSETGAGQTIAIYALAQPLTTDLTAFWSQNQVPQSLSNVQMINVAGGPTAPSADSTDEVSLDVEWASSLAPGAAIRVYAASETDPAENDEIFQAIYADLPSQPNMHVLSVSIGGNELDVPKDYLVLEAQYIANLASAGMTVLVASGDNGAVAEGKVQTTYPTSDPDVTGVGGTTLTLGTGNTVTSETAWSGSGGGTSVEFARPSWQTGMGVPAGTMRLVPDVASAADPSEGALVIVNGSSLEIGGTSWSAPTWAGFCALINQHRGTPLGFLNPKIYPLMGTSALRDITSGSNGTFSAGVGYDQVTGIGVPDVTALLAASLTSSPNPVVPAQLSGQVVTLGQPATFFVVGAGAPTLNYQWQRMASGSTTWANLSDSGTYGGSATPMLVVDGTTSAMTGDQFQCIVTNSSASATSSAASLTVNKVGVTTLAGWPGSSGSANGTGRTARFALAGGLRADNNGNIYVSDSSNYTIRKVTTAGVVTTVAGTPGQSGSTDGPAATALFAGVGGVAIDPSGNLFVADSGNYTIRKITPTGIVSTFAGVAGTRGEVDGTGSSARLYDPQNLAIDGAGNIYVSDGQGDCIRMITPAGVVTTLAGSPLKSGTSDGTGSAAMFNDPTGITVDGAGNVYVADFGNDTIRKIAPGGVVTTLAGLALSPGSAGGTGSAASFNGPAGVGVDSSGNVYVADANNDLIRKVDPTGFVTTVAGVTGVGSSVDGLASVAEFNTPGDVCVDNSGVVYVADAGNSTIRRIIPGLDEAPTFTAQPASQTINQGSSVTISVGITGTAPLSFQWYLNGAPISGATNPSCVVDEAQPSDAGSYTVTVTNVDGSATSAAAVLTVSVPAGSPDITVQPVGGPLPSGGSLALSVTVTGAGPFTFQWMLNGSPIAGANGPSYTATEGGSYSVSISNAVATTVSSAVVVGSANRLVNVSTRADVQTGGGIAIAGFVIDGAAGSTKQVLIRGVGPTLSEFSLTGVLEQPTLTLFDSSNTQIDSNTVWGTNADPAAIASISASVGAFALPAGSADSVLLENLAPGQYTAELTGANATSGVGLVEVYETNTSDPDQLINISTRAFVGTGANIMIAGFVVQGTQPAQVLVRAVGPTLASFSVTGFLPNPVLTVFDSTNTAIATNTGWGNQASPASSAQVTSVGAKVGAFALLSNSADSALVLTLQPGTYSVQVSDANGASGIALAEVYQVAQ